MKIKLLVVFVLNFFFAHLYADDFSVEDYGLLPEIKSVSISPDGKHYAFIKQTSEGNVFLIVNLEQQKVVGGANSGELKARSIYFATNEHVIISASKKARAFRVKGAWEQNTAVVYNIKTKKMKQLASRIKDLYIAQSGLGRIVGVHPSENTVYMPAFVGENGDPRNSLFRINLDNLSAKRHSRGNGHVIDWFVGKNGEVLAREEFHEKKQEHRVVSLLSGKRVNVFSEKTDIPRISIVAVGEDSESLIFVKNKDNYDAVYSLSLKDGSITGPLFEQVDSDIDAIMKNERNREITGVLYSGLLPNYQFTDASLQASLIAVQDIFPSSEIHLISHTTDKKQLILRVSGSEAANDYIYFDTVKRQMKRIGSGYPNVSKDKILPIKPIRYKARDGLPITAILTLPKGATKNNSLPLIVMPHGGPESYSSMNFDWKAQYFARKGYVVLQPNFRGSSGFGADFILAGRGKWGKEMQDDVSDGVKAMIKTGYVDAKRVCIIGSSYGGYSALAGGAFTPELYRCVVSVAGVSDLPQMLIDERRDYGSNHWVVSYWNRVIGDPKQEKAKLREISPINSADKFAAPLLLLHGKDDTVVPLKQSNGMLKAMRKAGKDVELITLRGEDHWLSQSETRLILLKEISKFLDKHNPVNVN